MKNKDFGQFLVESSATIDQALRVIEGNSFGVVFLINKKEQVIGSLSDGDIRRHLLSGGTISDPATDCCNDAFRSVAIETPREKVIKLLELGLKAIPVFDASGQLCDVITRRNIPLNTSDDFFVRAKSPARISFAGGGSDLTEYFKGKNTGAVISTTISLFSHATLVKRLDKKINIYSEDLSSSFKSENLDEALADVSQFNLVLSLLEIIRPAFGFDLYLRSDFPVGSGLGGSSAMLSAVAGCFNEYRVNKFSKYELAELVFQSERLHSNISGGWQDQYATVFGGLNFMEFNVNQNMVYPLRLDRETKLELEESLVLVGVGVSNRREPNEIFSDQRTGLLKTNNTNAIQDSVNLSYKIRNSLLRGEVSQLGSLLSVGWEQKKSTVKKSHLHR